MLQMLCFLLLLAIFESSIFLLMFAACADVEMCSMMLLCMLCRLLCSCNCSNGGKPCSTMGMSLRALSLSEQA